MYQSHPLKVHFWAMIDSSGKMTVVRLHSPMTK